MMIIEISHAWEVVARSGSQYRMMMNSHMLEECANGSIYIWNDDEILQAWKLLRENLGKKY